MNWLVAILALVAGGAIYYIAKQRGEKAKADQVMEHEEALDREEINNELEKKRERNAWDSLNDAAGKSGK